MTTLVIGAGLVGSQIARILAGEGETPVLMDSSAQPEALGEIVDLARVRLVAGDVLRPFALTDAIREHKVTRIIHTAANPLLTMGAQKDPYAAIQLNIMGTVNVLEAARVMGLERVVVSSSNVLSHYLAGGEGKGDLAREEALPRPTTFYSVTKQTVENLGLNYARWCNVDFAAVRYGAVAGPWSGRGGGGPSNVFREAVVRALRGEEAVVPPGAMEWVYSKDAAMGTVQALRVKDLKSRIFNVTMGRVTTPQELSAALKAVIPGAKTRIEQPAGTGPSLQGNQHAGDLSLSREVLGYVPKFPDAEAAVRDMVEWYRANRRAGA